MTSNTNSASGELKQPNRWVAHARWRAGRRATTALGAFLSSLSPARRHEALAWLEAHDAPLELDFGWPSAYRDSCLVGSHVVAPPAALVIPPDSVIPTHVGRQWGELRVHRVTGVVVDHGTSLVFHRDRVLTASGHGWRSARDGAFLSGAADRVRRTPVGSRVSGPVTPVGAVHNYGHFLLEALPRILRVREACPRVHAWIPGPVPGYARQILDLFGVDWSELPDNGPVACDDLWLCDPTPSGWPHPADVALMREQLRASVGAADTTPEDRLFISRRGMPRSLAGADRLEAQMADWGYTVLRPQELPFRDQVAAFAGAIDVVADFGAGMSTIVAMAPRGRVVDLMSGEWWTPHFRQMAAMLGLDYVIVPLDANPSAPYGTTADAIDRLAALAHPQT